MNFMMFQPLEMWKFMTDWVGPVHSNDRLPVSHIDIQNSTFLRQAERMDHETIYGEPIHSTKNQPKGKRPLAPFPE